MPELHVTERHDIITRQQAANILGVTPNTISNHVLAGLLSGEKVGPYTFVSRAEVQAWKADGGPSPRVAVDAKTQRRYSLTRALRQAAEIAPREGVEWEMHQEYRKVLGQRTNGAVFGDYVIPMWAGSVMAAGLDSVASTKGSELVITRPGGFGGPLRVRSAARLLGATFIESRFPFSIIEQTSAPDASWVNQNPGGDWAASTDETFGLIPFAAHTLTTTTQISRQLLTFSHLSTAADQIIARDFAGRFGAALDRASIYNNADANAPTGGILSNANINFVAIGTNGGAVTHDLTTALEEAVGLADGDFGNLGWATTPGLRRILRKTQRLDKAAAGGAAGFIWDHSGILDQPSVATRACPSTLTKGTSVGNCHSLIYGAWDSLVIGTSEAMEVIADHMTRKKQAVVEFTGFLMADVGIEQPKQFAACIDATLT